MNTHLKQPILTSLFLKKTSLILPKNGPGVEHTTGCLRTIASVYGPPALTTPLQGPNFNADKYWIFWKTIINCLTSHGSSFMSSVNHDCKAYMLIAFALAHPSCSTLGSVTQLIYVLIQPNASLMVLHTRSLKYWLHFRQSNWIDLAVTSCQQPFTTSCLPLSMDGQTIRSIHVKASTHTSCKTPTQPKGVLFILTVKSSVGFRSQSHRSVSQLCLQSLRFGVSWHLYAYLDISFFPLSPCSPSDMLPLQLIKLCYNKLDSWQDTHPLVTSFRYKGSLASWDLLTLLYHSESGTYLN